MRSPPRPLNVVVLIDILSEAGGAEILAAALLARLDPERFRRTMVAYRLTGQETRMLHSQQTAVKRLGDAGVRVLELGSHSRTDVMAWRPLVRLMRAGQVDVLHAHKFGPNLWASMLARIAPVPVFIAHEHTWSYEGRPLRRLADRRVIATRADVVLAVSEQDRQRMIDVERIPAQRLRLLPNGISSLSPLDNGADVRGAFDIPLDAPLVGAVGVMREQKDFATLLRAHVLVRESLPEAHLLLVGDGVLRDDHEAMIDELGLRSHVTITGYRPDATTLAAGFDVAVNSSQFEGASLAILEFMSLARPIVATAVGGTPELLDHGTAGLLVPPSDPRALSDAIVSLLCDPQRAGALGRRARSRQLAEYDIEVQVRRLQDLYEEQFAGALSERRPATT